jgi:hypothetical protein
MPTCQGITRDNRRCKRRVKEGQKYCWQHSPSRKEIRNERKLFWTTVPGILTAVAAIITAIGGLVTALHAIDRPPTRTPEPTTTQAPTVTLTATPAPCPLAPAGVFLEAWSDPEVGERIGCPKNRGYSIALAEQVFDGGIMLWRKDIDRIYALFEDDTWQGFANIWFEGDPEYSCPDEDTPSTSPPTPKRGFGKIWCLQPGVREKLGWAQKEEIGTNQPVQDFERGAMIQSMYSGIAILYEGGTWQQYSR